MLPESIKPALEEHLRRVRAIHQQDLADGFGEVPLPKTTMIYTHVLNRGGQGVRSPADLLL